DDRPQEPGVDRAQQEGLVRMLLGRPGAEEQQPALRQRLDHDGAGHEGQLREVSGEEVLVAGDVLQAADALAGVQLEHAVDEQEGVAGWDQARDLVERDHRAASSFPCSRSIYFTRSIAALSVVTSTMRSSGTSIRYLRSRVATISSASSESSPTSSKRWLFRCAHSSSSGFSETSATTSVTARSTLSAYITVSFTSSASPCRVDLPTCSRSAARSRGTARGPWMSVPVAWSRRATVSPRSRHGQGVSILRTTPNLERL